ncbi:MAG: hypothetical protein ACHQ0J_05150 [Candidatus Dormibacterales bacterium]
MRIDVHFTRGDLWYDLGTKPYELTEGLSVRLRENHTRKGIAAYSEFGHFLVDHAASIPIDVAVALLSSWLYDKLKRHKAKITIDRTEIEVDDEGKVKKLIKEHLENEP